MSATSLESISSEALVLPPEERMELALRLLSSVDAGSEAEADKAWSSVISERIARYDAGGVPTISADEAFTELSKIVPGA
ncbi:addiction module protein [Luteolibacter sp. LG18]|uniref:addiction module protein n=1 Tax=Luteolibacter sp. LG18 TaxID=2819286 RepID=UPI002B317ABD|nr:hypothetical protein llg_40280 [Luteolibacter sp. LG18]